jgi:CubicO group peptidase (beta-lactamase class C family)
MDDSDSLYPVSVFFKHGTFLFFLYYVKKMRERVQLILKFLFLVFVIALVILVWEALPIITGYAAKVACSAIFLAGRPQDQVLRNDLAFFPVNLASCSVDTQDSSVTASVLGLAKRKAVYRWRLGATLVSGVTEESLRDQHMMRSAAPAVDADTIDWPMGDRMCGGRGELGIVRDAVSRAGDSGSGPTPIDTAKLATALGLAFGDGSAPQTGTRAVLVVYRGQLIAERYAPGFDRHTRLAGWSMTKGVLNALIGILVKEGLINTGAPAPIALWRGDDRKQITVADLMHMNSGLRWWEFYDGPSDATVMLFKESDMGGYAERSPLLHPPGKVFNYSSGAANILSAIVRKTLGDDRYYRFPYEELFARTGMNSAILEPDAGGTYVGSSYCYATARDWARLGLLYLHDGVAGGQRILPEGWVRWTTEGSSYGALWWLNKIDGDGRRDPRLPADCYSCEGYEGQYIWVVPSKDLVVVRLAMEHGTRLSPGTFLGEVLRALP